MIGLEQIKQSLDKLSNKLRIDDYLPKRYIDLNERKYYWKIKSPPPLKEHEYKAINSEEEAYRLLFDLCKRHGMI